MRTVFSLIMPIVFLLDASSQARGQETPSTAQTARVDALIQKLKSREDRERYKAIKALQKMGADARAAIPALTEVARSDSEEDLRDLAQKCLATIRDAILPIPDVNVLIQSLKSREESERYTAIKALKKMASHAKAAIPALTEVAQNDSERELREMAKKCLDAINGRSAVNSGSPVHSQVKPSSAADHNQGERLKEKTKALEEELKGKRLRNLEGERLKEKTKALEEELKGKLLRNLEGERLKEKTKALEEELKGKLLRDLEEEEDETDNHYGILTIHNNSDDSINYSYKIGDGNWHQAVINPGERDYYWNKYDYPNENASPSFQIRFDSDLGPGTSWKVYTLRACSATSIDPDLGRDYDFKRLNNNLVDIYGR